MTNFVEIKSMTDLLYINWTMDPRVIASWNTPRWYGLMWAMGFYLGFIILTRIYKNEKAPEVWMDKTFLYVLLGGILGARLGHCLFYQPDIYLSNPIEILYIWEGGLASHGGAVAILISLMIYSRKVVKKPLMWILDRIVAPIAIAACFIRLGNLMNHEIVGVPTEVPWAFVFHRGVDLSPRHPAQLYEAIFFVIILLILGYMYLKTDAKTKPGLLTGWFFVLVPSMRFGVEFIKNSQGGLESNFGEILSTGQLLSIPFILVGALLILRSSKLTNKSPAKKIGSTID